MTRAPKSPAPPPPDAPPPDALARLQAEVAAFNRERRWRKFHSPKNLAMALGIEAAELMEPFRWLTPAESWRVARTEPTASSVRDELADVMLLALSMAGYLGIDLVAATRAKLERNRQRYPADRARGRADKYTAYQTAQPAGSRVAATSPAAASPRASPRASPQRPAAAPARRPR